MAETIVRKTDHGMSFIGRIIGAIGTFIIGILALRFVFILLGANPQNSIANFVYEISTPLVSPFFGLFNYTPQLGIGRFEFETLIAILFYAIAVAILTSVFSGRRR